jgi:hypothetical protein
MDFLGGRGDRSGSVDVVLGLFINFINRGQVVVVLRPMV